MTTSNPPREYPGRSKWFLYLAVIGLFIIGTGVRLLDLKDPPLESAYQQLHAAIIARGMYYQMLPEADPGLRQAAVHLYRVQDAFEPPIFERIVAATYLLTGEQLWIPRLYAILFWMVGGAALFLLSRRMTSNTGALVALAFYLILPFGVIQSRRFQPEPFMVMWVMIAALALYNWEEKRDTRSALLAGLACGLAVVVKAFAVFFIAGMALAMVFFTGKAKRSLRDFRVWLMAGIMIILPAVTYLGFRGNPQGYLGFWTMAFIDLLTKPWFYNRWYELLNSLFGGVVILIALAGVIIMPPKARALLVSLWLGYLVFGMFEPWQIHTHDYYSLILVPIVALSIASVATAFFDRLAQQPRFWQAAFSLVAVLALVLPAWKVRSELVGIDSRINWIAWTRLGKALPNNGQMIALTDAYGTYVEYFGWRLTNNWPTSYDLNQLAARGGNTEPDFEKYFRDQTRGMDYFLVTAIYDLENQPQLKSYLENHFAKSEGDGYLLYDLNSPLNAP